MAHSSEALKDTTKQRFIDIHRENIYDLFHGLGWQVPRTDAELIAFTQPRAMGDHFNPENGVTLTSAQEQFAWESFAHMGMMGEISALPGVYDRVFVLGGTQATNNRRFSFLQEELVDGSAQLSPNASIVILGGNRNIFPAEESEFMDDLLTAANSDKWAASKLLHEDCLTAATEAEGLRLSAANRLGHLTLEQLHLRVGLVPKTHDIISHYLFRGQYPLTLINANPVHRELGNSRHTTSSTTEEAISILPKLPNQARILFVSSNPYIYRTTQNVRSALAHNSVDAEVFGCGPAIAEGSDVQLCFGELARVIFEDSR